jgi:hypothetical protein
MVPLDELLETEAVAEAVPEAAVRLAGSAHGGRFARMETAEGSIADPACFRGSCARFERDQVRSDRCRASHDLRRSSFSDGALPEAWSGGLRRRKRGSPAIRCAAPNERPPARDGGSGTGWRPTSNRVAGAVDIEGAINGAMKVP